MAARRGAAPQRTSLSTATTSNTAPTSMCSMASLERATASSLMPVQRHFRPRSGNPPFDPNRNYYTAELHMDTNTRTQVSPVAVLRGT